MSHPFDIESSPEQLLNNYLIGIHPGDSVPEYILRVKGNGIPVVPDRKPELFNEMGRGLHLMWVRAGLQKSRHLPHPLDTSTRPQIAGPTMVGTSFAFTGVSLTWRGMGVPSAISISDGHITLSASPIVLFSDLRKGQIHHHHNGHGAWGASHRTW